MKAYRCRVCDNALYFENSRCVHCGSLLAYAREEKALVPLVGGSDDGSREAATYVDASGRRWYPCSTIATSGCTWLADEPGGLCLSCRLTRTRPADADVVGMAQFRLAETAKRHLVVELDALRFPVRSRSEDQHSGLAFDLLSSVDRNVTIGHASGLITIDLAESDDAYRENVRAKMDEPYRTMLGHFRHEIGHYYEWLLVTDERIEECRELFGDERESYADSIERHYREGPPEGWEQRYISAYATMHPWEDFAETFAHYLHICDTVDTAAQQGLITVGSPTRFGSFRDLVNGVWIPLSIALNQINRSMGKDPLYPFVIPTGTLDKLDFVASLAPSDRTQEGASRG